MAYFKRLDYSLFSATSYGDDLESSFLLNQNQVKLLLKLLSFASNRFVWFVDGFEPDDSQWDEIDDFVSGSILSLMLPGMDQMRLSMIVTMSSEQTLTSAKGTDDKVLFGSKEYDPNNDYNLSTNKWVVPDTANYLVGATLGATNQPNNGYVRIKVSVNGTFKLSSGNQNATETSFRQASFQQPIHLTSGDEVEFYIAHNQDTGTVKTGSVLATQRAWAIKL